MALYHGTHCVKTAVTTQTVQALASGEAEFYSAVKCASHLLGLRAIAIDFGIVVKTPLSLEVDSSSAIGTMSRRGAGKIRHIQTPTLWLQRLVTSKEIVVKKLLGEKNPTDIGTKHMTAEKIARYLPWLSQERRSGIDSNTLQIQTLSSLD